MDFRIIATVARRSSTGTAYRHTIYMAEFDHLACTEGEARDEVQAAIRARMPGFEGYSLESEYLNLPRTIH